MEDIEANENKTPFSIHFHARMPKTTTKNCVDRSANLEAAVAPANVLIVNPNRKALHLISAFIYYSGKKLRPVYLDVSRSFGPQNRFGSGQGIVGGKYGRSEDAATVFFVSVTHKTTV